MSIDSNAIFLAILGHIIPLADHALAQPVARYAASAVASRWTLDHIASKLDPANRLDNVKRYPALPGAPLFATGMKMSRLESVRANYKPHFSRHNLSMATFMRHIGVMPNDTDNTAFDAVDGSTPPVSARVSIY